MTIDWDRVIARAAPVTRKVWDIAVSTVTFCWGGALTLAGGGVAILAATQLRLPDAVLLLHDGRHPPPVSDIRDAMLFFIAVGVGVLISGLHILHDWRHPHRQQAERIAALETELIAATQFAVEAEQRAENTGWAIDALAAIEDVFRLDGVLEAARRAARKALHPDGHPGAAEFEIRDLTERFQAAEAVFDRLAN